MIQQLIHVEKNNVNDKDVNKLKILQEVFVFKRRNKNICIDILQEFTLHV